MKKILALSIALLLLTTVAFAATNQTDTVQIILDAGELELSFTNAFVFENVALGSVTYPHTAVPTDVPDFTLADKTGTGAGWNVQFSMTQLQDAASHQLDVEIQQAAATTQLGLVNGQAISAYPKTTDISWASMPSGAQKVVETDTGYGMGEYTYTINESDFRLIIEATEAFAGTYTGTFTAEITPGK